MDLMTSNTNNTNTNSISGVGVGSRGGGGGGVTKVEAEVTPSPRIMTASLPCTNGVLKHHKQQEVVLSGGVIYKECLKNHAANMGGHALDGCGEFMPAQTAAATDPRTLKCAACRCHRNFHRLERVHTLLGAGLSPRVMEYHPQNHHLTLPPPPVRSPESDNDSPPPISSTYYSGSAPHMLLALSSGGGTTPTTPAPTPTPTIIAMNNEKDSSKTNNSSSIIPDQIFGSRKRFRTKFTQEQKDRMSKFAEKVGWKMQKSTSDLINGFCDEIGVHREVFKVWMHNNKNTLGKRSAANYVISPNLNHNHNLNIQNRNQDGINNGNGVGNSNSSGISHHNLINNASSSSS